MPSAKKRQQQEAHPAMVQIVCFFQLMLRIPFSFALRMIPSPRIVTAEILLDNQVVYSSQHNF